MALGRQYASKVRAIGLGPPTIANRAEAPQWSAAQAKAQRYLEAGRKLHSTVGAGTTLRSK